MNTLQYHRALLTGVLSATVMIAACSDSGERGSRAVIPEVEELNAAVLIDNTLFGFVIDEKDESFSYPVHTFPDGPIVAIDTDNTREITLDGGDTSNTFNPAPEFYVYAEGSQLFALELDPIHVHNLFDFADPELREATTICDLKAVVSFDDDAFFDNDVVYRDEEAIYVRSTVTRCDSTVASDFRHHRVDFRNSDETYTVRVRRNETESIDGEEITTRTTVTERNSELEGQRFPVDAARMYAHAPIADVDGDRLGYLGLDPDTLTLTMYVVNMETNNARKVWAITDTSFAAQREQWMTHTLSAEGFAPAARKRMFSLVDDDQISMEYADSIVVMNFDDLFDDDRRNNIITALANPIYTFTSDDYRFHQYTPDFRWLIGDGTKIITIEANGEQNLVRDLAIESLDSHKLAYAAGTLITKSFTDDTSALTFVPPTAGLETTIVPRTADDIRMITSSPTARYTVTRAQTTPMVNFSGRLFVNGGERGVGDPNNLMFTRLISQKGTLNATASIERLQAETTLLAPSTDLPVLFEPVLSINDEAIARLPDIVHERRTGYEFNEELGIITVTRNRFDADDFQMYFFDPKDYDVEGTGGDEPAETPVMKLIYDNLNPPLPLTDD